MHLKIFSCPYSSRLGNFDDRALQEFIKDKEILSVASSFFVHEELPYWTVLVQYKQPSPIPLSTKISSTSSKKPEDVRHQIPEADQPLFESLRAWRAEKAKKEGVPPYVICTNQHLLQMILKRPHTLSQLSIIEGFGANKIEKYGTEILALLAPTQESQDV